MRLSEHYPSKVATMWQDYFLLVILTGMRRNEINTLAWENVDFTAKTLILRDTKNRDDHAIAMSDFMHDIFLRRRAATSSQYVFPADSESGHIVEPRKAMLKVAELSGISFTIHDGRRTFITIAESLDIPAYALKKLMNHRMSNDVTAGYIVADVERLRKPMQLITDYILKCMGLRDAAAVMSIQSSDEDCMTTTLNLDHSAVQI